MSENYLATFWVFFSFIVYFVSTYKYMATDHLKRK